MLTNNLKKGAKIILQNGWHATIADNMRGNIRLAEVQGLYTETGSIYAHNIKFAVIDGKNVLIELTDNQKKSARIQF